MPAPGEPLFLAEDTAAALALVEEERDTCSSCGMLKVWCRDPEHQFSFEPVEEVCWPTQRLAVHRKATEAEATRQATQLSWRFRKGHSPRIDAGLNLEIGG